MQTHNECSWNQIRLRLLQATLSQITLQNGFEIIYKIVYNDLLYNTMYYKIVSYVIFWSWSK